MSVKMDENLIKNEDKEYSLFNSSNQTIEIKQEPQCSNIVNANDQNYGFVKEEIVDEFKEESSDIEIHYNFHVKQDYSSENENNPFSHVDSEDQDFAKETRPLPLKRNKPGKIIGESERLCIVNMYKTKITKDPKLSIRQIRKMISDSSGIGQSTIYKIIKEYNATKSVSTPTQKRARKSFRDLIDDLQRSTIRGHVHSIWLLREIPTLDKIHQVVSADDSLPPIARTNLFHLLKEMNFHYSKRGRNSALVEKNKIVLWRRQYLQNIIKYRNEGRHVYFLGETCISAIDFTDRTWVNSKIKSSHRDTFIKGKTTGSVSSLGKEKRLIVLNIGSEDGFVPNGLLSFESKKNSHDYHNEINEETFHEWIKNILPRLQPNSVIVMDNASYHSVEVDKAPTSVTQKADIIKWLEDKGEIIDKTMVIPELLLKVKRLKPLHKKYVIDELAKVNNNIILRLPPYHSELNPIQLAWSLIKSHVMNNTTYKLPNVEKLLVESINHVDADMWKTFISQSKKEEKKLYEIDLIIDEVLFTDLSITITGDSLSSTDSD